MCGEYRQAWASAYQREGEIRVDPPPSEGGMVVRRLRWQLAVEGVAIHVQAIFCCGRGCNG